MQKKLLTGNEAIALGAYEGGVTAAFGYPGTPSTEILENLAKYSDRGVYAEWSPNEKVALEAAAGAAIAGARTIVVMKCVGLNVALDPLMTLAYTGIAGGMLVIVADDPGQYSSQTEQDTRQFARLAKLPILEPADAGEARDFVVAGFDISEKYRCPVIIRTTTCVSHSRSLVAESAPRHRNETKFVKDNARFIPIPVWGRAMRRNIEDRMRAQALDSSANETFNKVFRNEQSSIINHQSSIGIISHGVTALHCREIFPETPILKLGWAFPFPDDLIRKFAATVGRVIVIEEVDDFLEEHVKSLGIKCDGKGIVPRCGELTPATLKKVRRALFPDEQAAQEANAANIAETATALPPRPPVLCPGCPHRGLFMALGKFDVIVNGDIGCYSLGVFPPLSCTDTMLCMGGGFTLAHGMQMAGEKRKCVGIVGDSTFFHSGITGLLDVVYNKGTSVLVVADNSITAMTGHQEHPGTGVTLMGATTKAASIEAIAEACGIARARIRVVNPYDQDALIKVFAEELAADEPSLVITRAPCPLREKKRVGALRRIDTAKCKNCRACLKCGCPAIEAPEKTVAPRINETLCAGCGLCESPCKFGAINSVLT